VQNFKQDFVLESEIRTLRNYINVSNIFGFEIQANTISELLRELNLCCYPTAFKF